MKKEYFEAIVGPRNTGYYISKFEAFQGASGKSRLSWNWPAFLFNVVWALYRKLYGSAILLFAIAFAASILDRFGSVTLSGLTVLCVSIFFGLFANFLYFRKALKAAADAEVSFNDASAQLEYLRKKGGVHSWVPWTVGSISLVGIIAAIVIPAFVSKKGADGATPPPVSRSVSDGVDGGAKPPTPIKGFIEHGNLGTVMPLEAKDKLTGRVSLLPDGTLVGNIYNGTSDWTVREVVINLMEPNWFIRSIDADKNGTAAPRMEKYSIQVHVPPFSNRDFSVSVNWRQGEKFEWNIWQARGIAN
jgi:hypothetical protein